MLRLSTSGLAVAATLFAAAGAHAQDLNVTLVQSGISSPLYAVSPPGDFNRLFVLEQNSGRIRISDLNTDTLLGPAFLDIGSLIASGGDRGLLGLAFDPDFLTNGIFYVSYTNTGGDSRIARYGVTGDPATTNVANALSADIVVAYSQPFSNHNGGWIGFGPDGYLYVSTGDGGSGGDPGDRASNPNVLLGKILRLDMSTDSYPTDSLNDYGWPASNPFTAAPGRPEIFMLGLRNAWRCAFDRETGDLWIGDVGQNAWEEVDFIPAGQGAGWNLGWRCREGAHPFTSSSFCTSGDPSLIDPVTEYSHSLGCSISGGYPYRGALPSLRGKYLFADYCTSRIWTAELTSTTAATRVEITADLAIPGSETIPSFGQDELGRVYICDFPGGEIWRIGGTENTGTPYCFGDGSGTACACGNEVLPGSGAGCRNETGTGAALSATGAPSGVNDSMVFNVNGASPNSFGLLFSGDNQLASGLGVVAFDGLRCMGGGLVRHGTRAINAVGRNLVTWGTGTIAQGMFVSGQTRNYQCFYRSSTTEVCMTGVNTSNAVAVTFLP